MSITRRALLGTFLGLPLGVKVTQATEIGDITITGIPGFDGQRIEDIGDAFLLAFEHQIDSRGIRFTKTIDHDWPATWSVSFLLPSEDANKSILYYQRMWSTPAMAGLLGELREHHNSECRYYGVIVYRHEEGVVVSMSFSHDEMMPEPSALYSKWVSAL
jgi:hypothetical protein